MRRHVTAVVFILFYSALSPASSSGAHPSSSRTRVCDSSVLTPCGDLAKAPLNASHDNTLKLPVPKDGGAIFNLLALYMNVDSKDPAKKAALATQLSKMMVVSTDRQKQALATAERVRRAAIKMIAAGTPSADQQSLITRLNLIKIDVTTNPHDLCMKDVQAGSPNAGYDDETHALFICTAATNITETQLIHILGHEFGHSVSPCMSSTVLYEMKKDSLYPGPLSACMPDYFPSESGSETAGESGEDAPAAPPKKTDQVLDRLIQNKNEYAILPAGLPIVKELVACGIAKAVPKTQPQPSTVFHSTMLCLDALYSSRYNAAIKLDTDQRRVLNDRLSVADAKAAAKAASPAQCERVVEEHFADSFEAKLVGQIAHEPPWSTADFQTAFLEKQAYVCKLLQIPESQRNGSEDPRYPSALVRAQTVMDDPSIRDLMTCEQPTDMKHCPLKISGEAAPKLNSEATNLNQTFAPAAPAPARALK